MQVTVSVHSCTLKLLELTVEINKVAGASSNTDTNRISMYWQGQKSKSETLKTCALKITSKKSTEEKI